MGVKIYYVFFSTKIQKHTIILLLVWKSVIFMVIKISFQTTWRGEKKVKVYSFPSTVFVHFLEARGTFLNRTLFSPMNCLIWKDNIKDKAKSTYSTNSKECKSNIFSLEVSTYSLWILKIPPTLFFSTLFWASPKAKRFLLKYCIASMFSRIQGNWIKFYYEGRLRLIHWWYLKSWMTSTKKRLVLSSDFIFSSSS